MPKPLTLHPLKFSEVVTDILKVKPEPKPHKKPKAKRKTKARNG